MFTVAILTISDRSAAGVREDLSGPAIQQLVQEQAAFSLSQYAIVPDELAPIQEFLRARAAEGIDLLLTTGGTGFAPRDITPEATAPLLERPAPGIAEALRAYSLRITPFAMLSRGVAGIRGRTLIINLPGSPKAVRESLDYLFPILPHALKLLRDEPAGH